MNKSTGSNITRENLALQDESENDTSIYPATLQSCILKETDSYDEVRSSQGEKFNSTGLSTHPSCISLTSSANSGSSAQEMDSSSSDRSQARNTVRVSNQENLLSHPPVDLTSNLKYFSRDSIHLGPNSSHTASKSSVNSSDSNRSSFASGTTSGFSSTTSKKSKGNYQQSEQYDVGSGFSLSTSQGSSMTSSAAAPISKAFRAQTTKKSYNHSKSTDRDMEVEKCDGEESSDQSSSEDDEHGEAGDKEKYKAKNREHAKNTRRRKKSYIDTLKTSLTMLATEMESRDNDKRILINRIAEQMMVRSEVLLTMLQFRAQGETDVNRWKTIIDEAFVMTLPITPYRSFPPVEVFNNRRYVTGIESLISDTASFRMMVQNIIPTSRSRIDMGINSNVMVQYITNSADIIINNDSFMTKVTLQSLNAVELGARFEIQIPQMVRATYSPLNKLIFVDFVFDVMNVMQQLRRASYSFDFQTVPNNILIAKEYSSEARMVVETIPPFRVVFVNQSWCDTYGVDASEINNTSCGAIVNDFRSFQSRDTDLFLTKGSCSELFSRLSQIAKSARPCFSLISLIPRSPHLPPSEVIIKAKMYPLYSMDLTVSVTHILLVMETISTLTTQPEKFISGNIVSDASVSILDPSRSHHNHPTRLQQHKKSIHKGSLSQTGNSNNQGKRKEVGSNSYGRSEPMITSNATSSENTNSKVPSMPAAANPSNSSWFNQSQLAAEDFQGNSYFSKPNQSESNVVNTSGINVIEGMNENFDLLDDDYDAIYGEGYSELWIKPFSGGS